MGELLDRLEAYDKEGVYPFHMPGHKRNVEGAGSFFSEWFRRDLTEIPGMDDLHAPTGILKDAQERAASLYGAQQSFYLINGSTAGVLAAISAALPYGGTLLLQRASHRSAYHAVQLRGLKVRYLYGRQKGSGKYGTVGTGVAVEEVRQALVDCPEIGAVFLTSPSYDGFSSDLSEIASFLHEKNIPLLIDAAHGAHFGFSEYFPKSALQEGADVVVMSVHKTLPAPTQTALLHLGSTRIRPEKIRQYLCIYQTSSPSYLLMAGIDDCVKRMAKENRWPAFHEKRRMLSERLHALRRIGVWDAFGRSRVPGRNDETAQEIGGKDFPELGKILLFSPAENGGVQLGEALAAEGIQCEMALPAYVLLICTVMDTEEGYQRLAEVLEKLDGDAERLPENAVCDVKKAVLQEEWSCSVICGAEQEICIADAADAPSENIALSEAAGRISAAYVSVYPPGQPILVPGEQITKEHVEIITGLLQAGTAVQGIGGGEG